MWDTAKQARGIRDRPVEKTDRDRKTPAPHPEANTNVSIAYSTRLLATKPLEVTTLSGPSLTPSDGESWTPTQFRQSGTWS